jgi:hypothetical protein
LLERLRLPYEYAVIETDTREEKHLHDMDTSLQPPR